MIVRLAFIAACAVAAPTALAAQSYPMPDAETPRIQSVTWVEGETIVLTALPNTGLTVMLEPGETILRAILTGDDRWRVNVSAETDSFQVRANEPQGETTLEIETSYRTYNFRLETDVSLQAAYLVRLKFDRGLVQTSRPAQQPEPIENLNWTYRLKGDREVRPASIRDNGEKTVIEYAPGQALPAVFAIGPTGKEVVVDGYMRDGRFVIDRVHDRLVFRIDKEKATARRNKQRDEG